MVLLLVREDFAAYVNPFFKIKKMASGWPQWCRNNEERNRYIATMHAREGIQLQQPNIAKILDCALAQNYISTGATSINIYKNTKICVTMTFLIVFSLFY